MTIPNPTVIKAGGSLLGDLAALERVAARVAARRREGERVALVVSALTGVTDRLESELWRTAAGYRAGSGAETAAALAQRHLALADALDGGAATRDAIRRLEVELARLLERSAHGCAIDRARQARILSYGERLSAPLVAAAIRAAGADARAVSAEELGLVGTGPIRSGRSDLPASRAGIAALAPELGRRVLVVTGFYGLNSRGQVVLFGRGGTDYSAGVIAALLDAGRLEFWKDLPGYFTANPKRVASARPIDELTFEEASLLGHQGARILHPHCLEPLGERQLSVAVGLPDEPAQGTRLVRHRAPERPRVRAIAVRAPRTVVRMGRGRTAADLEAIGRRLTELESAHFALDGVMVSAAALAFSVVDDRPYDISRALASLNGTGRPAITIRRFPASVGLVGDSVARDPAVAEVVEECLAAAGAAPSAAATALGDSALRCRLERHELGPALAALHARLFPATDQRP